MSTTLQNAMDVFEEAHDMLRKVDAGVPVEDYVVAINAVQDRVNDATALLAQVPTLSDDHRTELHRRLGLFEEDRDDLEIRRLANGFVE